MRCTVFGEYIRAIEGYETQSKENDIPAHDEGSEEQFPHQTGDGGHQGGVRMWRPSFVTNIVKAN